MPGSTDNPNLLAAANQIIVALNEISTQISGGNSEALSRIGDAIEAQTTMLETRSVAETEAQNTNFSELIDAVDNISLSVDVSPIAAAISNCCSNLQVQLGNIRLAIQNIRLQPPPVTGGGGYYNGDTGGQYLDDPPIDNPEPQVNEYVCKAANYIYSWMDTALGNLGSVQSLKLTSEQQIISYIMGIVSTVLGTLATGPGGVLIGSTVLALTEMALNHRNVLVLKYFEVTRSKFAEHKEEIICDLYNAGVSNNPAAARGVYNTWLGNLIEQILTVEIIGIPFPLSEVLEALLRYGLSTVINNLSGYYLCNLLFEVDPDVEAAEIEGEVECDACGSCGFNWDFTTGNGGFVQQSSSEFNCGTSDVSYELEFPGWYLDITTETALPGCTMATYIKKTGISILASGIAVAGALQTPGQNSGIQYRIIGTQDEEPYDSGEISTGQVFGSEAHQFSFPAGEVLVSEVWIGISGTGFGGAPDTHSVIRLTSLGLIC